MGARRGGRAAGPAVRGTTTGINSNPTVPPHQAGDTLLVAGVYTSGATPTASGWTRIVAQDDGSVSLRLVVFKKENAPGTDTHLSPSDNPPGPWVAVADRKATAVDAVAAGNTGSGAAVTCPSVTVVAPPVLLHDFILAAADTGAPVVTVPAGEAAVNHVPSPGGFLTLAHGTKTVTAAGATGTRAASADQPVVKAVGSVAVR